ncbi:MAG TPA: HAMP domain-containing sensor histidine kinase [Candidatus Polarisedimenticolaceae bacterium]|nr:HAMP domain-containing sensor histidine kinase [Candidatus Polarisedimenticolaceae bacterium]
MPLHEIIAKSRVEIVARWTERVRNAVAPRVSAPELIDHLPQFLDALIAALRGDEKASARKLPSAAAVHGEQRLRLGFDLGALVHEYRSLHDVILETARAAGEEPADREARVLFHAILDGVGYAVSEYNRRRDAEFVHQANESLAFIAHELGSPLFSASMALRILRTTGQLPDDSDAVGALERGLGQTLEILEQSLDLARAASAVEIKPEETTLRERLEDARSGVSEKAEAKNVTLRLEAEDAPVVLDVRFVQSVLGHLARSAVERTPAGETVTLRARLRGGRIHFEVQDPEPRPDPEGLALAIARQAIEAHGGTIRVQDLPGHRCLFVLELPWTDPGTHPAS